MIDPSKKAIKDGSVFKGLAVPDQAKYQKLFLNPQFKLWSADGGHAIFEEHNGGYVFHLFNYTQCRTRSMTEYFIYDVAIPYCKERGLTFIQASAERAGMARKLVKMGFKNIGNNVYQGEVANVL